MAKSTVKTGAGGRGVGFIVIVAVMVYILFSCATAVITVKDCDPYTQSWSFVPPRWVCDTGGNVSPN